MAEVRCFCLRVGDYQNCSCPDRSSCPECGDNCAPPKKKSLSLNHERKGKEKCVSGSGNKENDARFQFLTEEEFAELQEGYKPVNTAKCTRWALNNFEAWREARVKAQKEKCPEDLLRTTDSALLCTWLTRYVAETRTTQGNLYPPSTLYQLLAGLLRYMRDTVPGALNFLDKGDQRFKALHNSLDSLFRDLRTKNIGTRVKHAEVFTKEEEQMLWDKGILGTSNPQSLLNAAFYLNGKSFCLRGGEEHRRLCISQLVREYNPDRYVYTEAGSKNKKGTFMEMHIQNKVVPIYSSPKAGERCHVHILDLYLSKLPKDAAEKDVFYLRPLSGVPANPTAPWFQSVPIGRNQLGKMVPNMCTSAGIAGHKTNHSLHATAATDLFHANVPEKLIQERTGHKSVQALRVYQHTTDDQQKAVSEVLS